LASRCRSILTWALPARPAPRLCALLRSRAHPQPGHQALCHHRSAGLWSGRSAQRHSIPTSGGAASPLPASDKSDDGHGAEYPATSAYVTAVGGISPVKSTSAAAPLVAGIFAITGNSGAAGSLSYSKPTAVRTDDALSGARSGFMDGY